MGRLIAQAVQAPLVSRKAGKKILGTSSDSPSKQDINALKELLESGKIVPAIDRRYPLDQLAEAIGYVETGHARAKVVVTI
jgi:NADPH:quinone reductase-like Zn-dependent oxidoreductase